MTLAELLGWGGGGLFLLLTLVQVAPVKLNPWSALAGLIGRAVNREVLGKLDSLGRAQAENRQRLDEHIRADDERDADAHRARILHFNNELLRSIPHTKEEFVEILSSIDVYERYCQDHPEYRNNRAIHAIANIGRVYDDRLRNHDFL